MNYRNTIKNKVNNKNKRMIHFILTINQDKANHHNKMSMMIIKMT